MDERPERGDPRLKPWLKNYHKNKEANIENNRLEHEERLKTRIDVWKKTGDVERASKGAHKSYKNDNKKEKQEDMFSKLKAEIDAKRAELYKGYEFPTDQSRWTEAYRLKMKKDSEGRIGGTIEEQSRFFDAGIAKHPQCF